MLSYKNCLTPYVWLATLSIFKTKLKIQILAKSGHDFHLEGLLKYILKSRIGRHLKVSGVAVSTRVIACRAQESWETLDLPLFTCSLGLDPSLTNSCNLSTLTLLQYSWLGVFIEWYFHSFKLMTKMFSPSKNKELNYYKKCTDFL